MNLSAINTLVVGHFERYGSEEQIAKYMPGMLRGDIKLAWGLTEPDAGSDARRVKTHATPIGESPGYFKVNGRNIFITNGGKADLMVLIAEDLRLQSFPLFCWRRTQPGFQPGAKDSHGGGQRLRACGSVRA